MGVWQASVWKLILAGGPIMAPLILCSFFVLAIVIDRFLYYASIRTNPQKLRDTIFDLVKKDKIKEAIQLCDTDPSPVAKVFKAGLLKFGAARNDIKEAIEDEGVFILPKLEQKLTALSTIAHLSTLLGLLGTSIGLCEIFFTIQDRSASLNPITPIDLAGGMWQALIATVAGLCISILAWIAYNYFVQRVNRYVIEMERGGIELVNFLTQAIHTIHARRENL